MRARPTVAITGLEGRDNPYPGAAVARALRAARGDSIELVGFAYEPTLTAAFRGDLFDRVYLTPLPGDPSSALLRRLFEIHAERPLDVLVPALDSELPLYARHRSEIEARGIRMLIPSEAAVKRRFKQRLATWAQRHGIASPRTEVVVDPASFFAKAWTSFPCFVKGSLADAVMVESAAEAQAAFWRIAAKWGYPVLVQERLIGDEFDVCALVRPGGEPLASISIAKTHLSAAGKAVAAEVVEDAALDRAAAGVVRALQWEGPLEIELLRERSSGRFYLIEINARFPAWIGAAPGLGLNLPDLALRLALGEELSELRPARAGARFYRTSRTTLSPVSALSDLFAEGRLILRS
jgi:carbamoyl-phosphate synthase large subunit